MTTTWGRGLWENILQELYQPDKTKNRDCPNCLRDMGTKTFTPAQLIINVRSTSVQVKNNQTKNNIACTIHI